MATDCYERLLRDVPWQFKDKPNLSVLYKAVAKQLQDVEDFFDSIWYDRRLDTNIGDERIESKAYGKQLDGIGDVVCLTRAEAGLLMETDKRIEILPDEEYRKMLKYKILLNTSVCTYDNLIEGLRYFFDDEVRYHEEVNSPATIFLEVSPASMAKIAGVPIIKSAGVGVTIGTNGLEAAHKIYPKVSIFIHDTIKYKMPEQKGIEPKPFTPPSTGVLRLNEGTLNNTELG